MAHTDFTGRPIQVGDTLAIVNRPGAHAHLAERTVVALAPDHILVEKPGVGSDDKRRQGRITLPSRTIVLPDHGALTVELNFLRHFYDAIGAYLGPADDDIYHYVKEAYVKQGGTLPAGYGDEEA